MIHKKVMLASILLSLVVVTAIFQISERQLSTILGNLCYKLFRTSFIEQITWDDKGIPQRYLPGMGRVYDAELIARQASRGYDTRIDPDRLGWFLKGSDWILAHTDSSGIIFQPYDYPPSGQKAPWLSASTQSSATLAVFKRAGFERDIRLLARGYQMLNQLKPDTGKFCTVQADSSIHFASDPGKPSSLFGTMNTLSDLNELHQLTSDSLSAVLFNRGMKALVNDLPTLAPHGFLHDRHLYLGRSVQHHQLSQKLNQLAEAYKDSAFIAVAKNYSHRGRSFVWVPILADPSPLRIISFLLSWLVFTVLIYIFMRRPVKKLTNDEG